LFNILSHPIFRFLHCLYYQVVSDFTQIGDLRKSYCSNHTAFILREILKLKPSSVF